LFDSPADFVDGGVELFLLVEEFGVATRTDIHFFDLVPPV